MKTPTYLMQQNKLLSNNIGMQDKVYNLKNFVNTKCTETSRKLNFLATQNNSVDQNNLMWKEEYSGLLSELMNDMLDNKFTAEERAQFLYNRMTKASERDLKLRLIQHEVELFKEST